MEEGGGLGMWGGGTGITLKVLNHGQPKKETQRFTQIIIFGTYSNMWICVWISLWILLHTHTHTCAGQGASALLFQLFVIRFVFSFPPLSSLYPPLGSPIWSNLFSLKGNEMWPMFFCFFFSFSYWLCSALRLKAAMYVLNQRPLKMWKGELVGVNEREREREGESWAGVACEIDAFYLLIAILNICLHWSKL